MRDWGWFVIIQKTRGMIGLPNPEEELRILEEKANATYGEYKKALDVTTELESQMGGLKDDIKALATQMDKSKETSQFILIDKEKHRKSRPLLKLS